MERKNAYGTRVAVGQIWHDCDKRMPGRYCRVIGFDANDRVRMIRCDEDTGEALNGNPTRVSIDRMRPIATGWELYREAPALRQC